MYAPARDDEATSVARYIDQQLEAIRASALGLTEDQARSTPCRSALSIGGIIKHAVHGARNAATRIRNLHVERSLDEAAFAEYMASFVVSDDATVAGTIEEFDAARADLLAALAAADPDVEATEPPAPWDGIYQPNPIRLRFFLNHQIEEFARHAGHADIIREQIDGESVQTLVHTLAGSPANDFFTPYVAEPGTLLS
ncbi:mycothiol transferase [Jongsikchunia kroppenstedtii]|uniref:mycothiol transferase n=1 Tax=Jongsikchunia kroppenstedtii TaxID=1121721 RepID=UPI0003758967|nr:DUF664 domain-containing protein [Jongsikchunia kroppenstedtii]